MTRPIDTHGDRAADDALDAQKGPRPAWTTLTKAHEQELRNWLWQLDHHGMTPADVRIGPGSTVLVTALLQLARGVLSASSLPHEGGGAK